MNATQDTWPNVELLLTAAEAAAIVLWNTVYLDRVIQTLQNSDAGVNPDLLQHLSPLGWEHINLTGNYTWRNPTKPGRYRPLRQPPKTA